ncbi:MAG TPA: HEAT repeat domain-containing protein [Thermoanaerobaculaceae bacterium]|nr:HEAT repeat domain-containing protein [Thermoanaerobaculaceae bacterium]HPS77735.1 HEAT repeat domain-containing protein [Thermoanaerobaculaceae bacterium]
MSPWVRTFLSGCLVVMAGAPGAVAEETAVGKATTLLAEAMNAQEEAVMLQAVELAAGLSSPGLEEAGRRAAASPDRVERTLALELLGHVSVGRNRDLFVAALTSPFRSVRVRAVRALGTLKDHELLAPLTRVLEQDADPDVRALAAEALGAVGGQDERPALRRALGDPHPVVQLAAVLGLAESGDLEVGFELLGRAKGTSPAEAARLLGLVGQVPNRALVPGLAELLSSPDAAVRVAAAAAILRIDEHAR